MKAVILAGGRLDPDLAKETGLTWRSELPYQNQTFLDIVIEAMPGEVAIVGGPRRDDHDWREGGERFIQSFARGIEAGGKGRFLMASADLPFLTKETIKTLLNQDDGVSTIQYPIVEMSRMNAAFPNMPRTKLKLKEGEFTGGNVFIVDGKGMETLLPIMQQAYDARKNVLKLGKILGFPTLLALVRAKLIPGSVAIPELEAKVGRALKTKVRAIISESPELAADVDTLEHFLWLKTL
ncbi:MAG: nucleotidyltransferase family protein [Chthonomonas sp.]|nr:nucleotidyltransferase family protein [Chthonomonas sp.]